MMMKNTRLCLLGTAIVSVSLLAGCSKKPQQARKMPPPRVSVVTVSPQRLGVVNELPGRLQAKRVAQVRARVSGIVLKRNFKEGGEVRKGQKLFQIDPAPYQAALASAKASLARAEANEVQSGLKLKRYEPLVKIKAISQQEYDDADAAHKLAVAEVAAAKASVKTARLDLGYARVTSPITGRIGRALVTEGALVGQGEATQLALVQQLDPMYVNLTQSSADLIKMRKAVQKGQYQQTPKGETQVTLILEDGSEYEHKGKLLFSDITVDESTGMVTVRALFPNPERMLLPGTFVRARLQQAVSEQALSVPQQAVQRTNSGAIVMVADGEKNIVTVRPVTTVATHGDKWIISSGLKAGDRVIVEGLQKIRPGIPVQPVEWARSRSRVLVQRTPGQKRRLPLPRSRQLQKSLRPNQRKSKGLRHA